jgi:hypothetical protein
LNARARKYAKENPHIISKSRSKYRKNKRQNDPCFVMKHSLRRNIGFYFKKNRYIKKDQTESILGCSFEYFKEYIESKFEFWMSWDNYGLFNNTENFGWDLDHIVPISSASTEEEIKMLNHYTNFQPLCSYINRIIKKDKINHNAA